MFENFNQYEKPTRELADAHGITITRNECDYLIIGLPIPEDDGVTTRTCSAWSTAWDVVRWYVRRHFEEV